MNPILPHLRIEMREPERFRQAIAALESITTEVCLRFGKKRLTITQMDPANVCMVHLVVDASFCICYDVSESCFIAVNLHDLATILQRMQAHDTLTLTDHGDTLRVTFDDSKTERTYTLPYLDIIEPDQKLPGLKMKAATRLPSKAFHRAITDADLLGETIMFTSDEHGLTISAKRDDEFAYESTHRGATKSDGVQRAKYSVEYLKKIIEAKTVGGEALIEYSTDYPLRVTLGDEKLTITFILAPRVDSE